MVTRTGSFDSGTAGGSSVAADASQAWAAYQPADGQPWDLRRAAHLYRRAAFGGTWGELQQALRDGPEATVARLVRPAGDLAAFQKSFDDYDRAAGSSDSDEGPRAWWLRRMLETPHPLLEKMTLFWHSHFGISRARVKLGHLLVPLIHTIRRHALGSYADLLAAVLREPAAFLGLGADASRKALPSDRVARQLLAQYGPGPGGYDEQDVRETTRALTGWFVFQGDLRLVDREHDTGEKRILGQAGNWALDDAVRIVVQHPATARNVVGRVYRWLISETDEPAAGLLEPLAAAFHQDHDIGRLVETVLRSNAFFAPHAYRRRVKSPVELALSMIRPLEGGVPTLRLGGELAEAGQDLLRPPTIKGWLGGRYWLNPSAMIQRTQLAAALLTPGGAHGAGLDPAAVVRRHGVSDPSEAAKFLLNLMLDGDVSAETRDRLAKRAAGAAASGLPGAARELARDLVSLPEFQLG